MTSDDVARKFGRLTATKKKDSFLSNQLLLNKDLSEKNHFKNGILDVLGKQPVIQVYNLYSEGYGCRLPPHIKYMGWRKFVGDKPDSFVNIADRSSKDNPKYIEIYSNKKLVLRNSRLK